MTNQDDLSDQMLTAKWHHNQNGSWKHEDDVEDVGEGQWELPSCLARNTNDTYMRYSRCSILKDFTEFCPWAKNNIHESHVPVHAAGPICPHGVAPFLRRLQFLSIIWNLKIHYQVLLPLF